LKGSTEKEAEGGEEVREVETDVSPVYKSIVDESVCTTRPFNFSTP